MSTIWEAQDLYAGVPDRNAGALKNIHLKVSLGEKLALLGQEQGGRALLLRVLTGLNPRRQGSLSVLENPIPLLPTYADWDEIFPKSIRRKMGVALSREGLINNVSVREGLELLFRFKYGDQSVKLREGAHKIVQHLAHKFGFEEVLDLRPAFLSTAEKRLAAIARAFLSKPSIIVLEDPSEGIGNLNRSRMIRVISEIVSEPDRTVLISTDDLNLAKRFCSRWIVLDRGEIIFDGTQTQFQESDHAVLQSYKTLQEAA